jgi:hypothetical protein
MSGPYRGNQDIVRNYSYYFGQYDLFVSCFDHYYQDWKNSGLKIKEIFTTPKIEIEKTKWFESRNDRAGQSGFWQFWNIKSVIEQTPSDYDFYIKNRSDLFFSSKLDLNFDSLNKNSIYSSARSFHKDNWDEEKWINDEFYVGDRETMDVISRFVLEYYEIYRHSKNDSIGSNELGLLNFLKENKISINKIFNLIYHKNHNGVSIPTGYTENYQLENL